MIHHGALFGLAKLKIEARLKETAKIALGAPKPANTPSRVRRTGPRFGDKNVFAKLQFTVKNADKRESIRQVVFSPDGSSLALEYFSRISVYNAGTMKLRIDIGRNLSDYMKAIAYSPDGTVLAAGNNNGGLTLWDPGAHLGGIVVGF